MLTKMQFKGVRNEIKSALSGVENKYGIDFKPGNISYTDVDFTMQLKAVKRNIDGKSYDQIQFEKYCKKFDFSPEDYQKEILYDGDEYKLVGFNIKAKKYPILIENKDGVKYKAPANKIKEVLLDA